MKTQKDSKNADNSEGKYTIFMFDCLKDEYLYFGLNWQTFSTKMLQIEKIMNNRYKDKCKDG